MDNEASYISARLAKREFGKVYVSDDPTDRYFLLESDTFHHPLGKPFSISTYNNYGKLHRDTCLTCRASATEYNRGARERARERRENTKESQIEKLQEYVDQALEHAVKQEEKIELLERMFAADRARLIRTIDNLQIQLMDLVELASQVSEE